MVRNAALSSHTGSISLCVLVCGHTSSVSVPVTGLTLTTDSDTGPAKDMPTCRSAHIC